MKELRSTENLKPEPMALRFDWEDWMPYLEGSDLSDDQKKEFILCLWEIVLGFVDLGYHLNPTAEICGETIDLKAVLEAAVLNSEHGREAAE